MNQLTLGGEPSRGACVLAQVLMCGREDVDIGEDDPSSELTLGTL